MNPMQVQTTPYGLPWGYGIPKNAKKNHRDLENRDLATSRLPGTTSEYQA